MRKTIFTLLLCFWNIIFFGQELEDGNVRWSPNRKLSLKDFKIKTGNKSIEPILSQFSIITNSIGNLEVFKKNFNRKVENIFHGQASWIDTTQIEFIERQLDFQQIQFDLSEIHARKYRREILLNRKKLYTGGDFLNKISNKLIIEFNKRRLILFEQTNQGTDGIKITEWKNKIQQELDELSEFSYENTKKIKKPRFNNL